MQPEVVPLALNAWLRWDTVDRLTRRLQAGTSVVEVGCGQGAFGARLAARAGRYRGFEPDADSYAVAARRLSAFAGATVENRPLPDEVDSEADVVCAFEVLEHIEDAAGAAGQWFRWVRPGGRILISVPAHQRRFGPWDTAVGHFKRYERDDLSAVLTTAGFEVVRIAAYGFPLGYVLEAARNRLAAPAEADSCSDRTSRSGRLLQPKPWMSGLTRAITFPFRLLQRPFAATNLGTGWVAEARRPE